MKEQEIPDVFVDMGRTTQIIVWILIIGIIITIILNLKKL